MMSQKVTVRGGKKGPSDFQLLSRHQIWQRGSGARKEYSEVIWRQTSILLEGSSLEVDLQVFFLKFQGCCMDASPEPPGPRRRESTMGWLKGTRGTYPPKDKGCLLATGLTGAKALIWILRFSLCIRSHSNLELSIRASQLQWSEQPLEGCEHIQGVLYLPLVI